MTSLPVQLLIFSPDDHNVKYSQEIYVLDEENLPITMVDV